MRIRRRRRAPKQNPCTGLFLKPAQVASLDRRVWRAADLHIHTSHSADVLPSPLLDPAALLAKAAALGLEYVSFTDHDTMDAYDAVGWEREGLVTGVEITIRDAVRVGHTLHVNVYGLDRRQFKELRAIAGVDRNVERFTEYLRSENLPYVYNHPFWFQAGEKPRYPSVERIVPLFPVLEYNMHRVRRKNHLTLRLAAKHGKGVLAATDTHIGEVGRACTLAPGRTFREFFRNVERGNAYVVPVDLTTRVLSREITAWIDILFDPDVIKERSRYTGFRTVDSLINLMARGAIKRSRRLRGTARYLARTVSRSGAPAIVYVNSQNLSAYRINRHLERAHRS